VKCRFAGAKVRNNYELWITNYEFFPKNLHNWKELRNFAAQIDNNNNKISI
jgi:hypothetical protein